MNHQIKLFGEALPESEYGTAYFWFDSLSGSEKINELFDSWTKNNQALKTFIEAERGN